LEQQLKGHDEQIQTIFEAIQQLLTPTELPRKKIGFEVKEPKGRHAKRTRKVGFFCSSCTQGNSIFLDKC